VSLEFVITDSPARRDAALRNARRIAAADDMLDALQAVAVGYRDPNIWLGQVRAAIAKATGSAA
jgi:hypothetical protein